MGRKRTPTEKWARKFWKPMNTCPVDEAGRATRPIWIVYANGSLTLHPTEGWAVGDTASAWAIAWGERGMAVDGHLYLPPVPKKAPKPAKVTTAKREQPLLWPLPVGGGFSIGA